MSFQHPVTLEPYVANHVFKVVSATPTSFFPSSLVAESGTFQDKVKKMNEIEKSSSLETKVQWLVDRALISELLFSFARALDTGDTAAYVQNFLEDGSLVLPDPASDKGESLLVSRPDMEDFIQQGLLDNYTATQHISANHQIEITGDSAVSRSYLMAVHVKTHPKDHWQAGGWYDCSYVRTAEGWKFKEVKLTAVWLCGEISEIKPA